MIGLQITFDAINIKRVVNGIGCPMTSISLYLSLTKEESGTQGCFTIMPYNACTMDLVGIGQTPNGPLVRLELAPKAPNGERCSLIEWRINSTHYFNPTAYNLGWTPFILLTCLKPMTINADGFLGVLFLGNQILTKFQLS